jgi:hypothetical protein
MKVSVNLMFSKTAKAFNGQQYEAVEYIDDEEDSEELRQLVLNDEDDVVVPVTLNDPGNTDGCILRGQGQKVHDYCVSLSGMS